MFRSHHNRSGSGHAFSFAWQSRRPASFFFFEIFLCELDNKKLQPCFRLVVDNNPCMLGSLLSEKKCFDSIDLINNHTCNGKMF